MITQRPYQPSLKVLSSQRVYLPNHRSRQPPAWQLTCWFVIALFKTILCTSLFPWSLFLAMSTLGDCRRFYDLLNHSRPARYRHTRALSDTCGDLSRIRFPPSKEGLKGVDLAAKGQRKVMILVHLSAGFWGSICELETNKSIFINSFLSVHLSAGGFCQRTGS